MIKNPLWFDANYYMNDKLAQMSSEWTLSSLWNVFNENGFSNPYNHYVAHGNAEYVDPNALFNTQDYLRNKAIQMGMSGNEQWVFEAITNAGMTVAEHYDRHGYKEGINPSDSFDQGKYLQAKLYQMQGTNPSYTISDLLRAFDNATLTPVEHYLLYASQEGLTEADANALGYSYNVHDIRPVVDPNKEKGFDYTIDYSKNTVNTVDIERIITQIEEDGTISYRIETTTVDITRIEEVTNVTITGSVTIDLSDVLDMIGC